MSKEEIDELIRKLMKAMNTGNVSYEELETFFSHNLLMTRNKKSFCKSLIDFIKYLNNLNARISLNYDYWHKLLTLDQENPEHAAFYYEIHGPNEIFCQVSANIRILEGKIHEWREVLYTKDLGKEIFK